MKLCPNNRFEGKCETCIKGKLFKKPFGKNFEIKTKNCLDVIHTDVCGPTKNITPSGGKYFCAALSADFKKLKIFKIRS